MLPLVGSQSTEATFLSLLLKGTWLAFLWFIEVFGTWDFPWGKSEPPVGAGRRSRHTHTYLRLTHGTEVNLHE